MRITQYEEITKLNSETVFITDEEGVGARKIKASDLVNALSSIGPSPLDNMITNLEQRKTLYRGNDLGETVTKEQLLQIDSGEFKDLFVGDYWTIDSIVWRIADFDYWMDTGDKNVYGHHHLVIMPDSCLYEFRMNAKDTTDGGYVWSDLYTSGLEKAKSQIKKLFGEENILNHKEYLCNATVNGVPAGVSWYDSIVELPNELMMYGTYIHSAQNGELNGSSNDTIDKNQLAIMMIHQKFTNVVRETFWLRDPASPKEFTCLDRQGFPSRALASEELGIRPVFGLFAGSL